jgi:uncharacterized protein YndB with AHSA1/START domain
MWRYEHAVEADVMAGAVWRAWTDIESWGKWNADIEAIRIDGAFEVGARIEMTPRGADPVVLRITEARPGKGFVDEADLGGAVVTTTHRIEGLPDARVRIVYRTEITGPAADELGPEIGPAITADFPETLAALVEFAR